MFQALHDAVYVAALLPVVAVAWRYRSLPPTIPLSFLPNGRPIAYGPRWLLLATSALVAVVLPLAALALHAPGAHVPRTGTGWVLIYLVLIETPVFVAALLALEADVALGKRALLPPTLMWGGTAVILITAGAAAFAR